MNDIARKKYRARGRTRQQLVDAATMLMWRHGIGEVTVDMILEHAGVLKGSFYHWFPAKADLLVECLDQIWKLQSAELASIYTAANSPREAVEAHLAMLRRMQIDARDAAGIVPGTFNMSMPNVMLHQGPRVAAKLRQLMDAHLYYFERGLAGIEEQIGLPNAVGETARVLSYTISGAMLAARMTNDLKPLDDLSLILQAAIGRVEPKS